jgi:hypothetical protein
MMCTALTSNSFVLCYEKVVIMMRIKIRWRGHLEGFGKQLAWSLFFRMLGRAEDVVTGE